MRKSIVTSLALCCVLLLSAEARAQGAPPAYGEPINIENAKKAAAAAEAEAKKNNWPMCISVVAGFFRGGARPRGQEPLTQQPDALRFQLVGLYHRQVLAPSDIAALLQALAECADACCARRERPRRRRDAD